MDDKLWYNAAYINKIELVFSLYPQLNISSEQLMVVMAILWQQKSNDSISIDSLCQSTRLSNDKVNQILSSLSAKGYLVISTKKNKVEFNLDGIFQEKNESLLSLDTNLFSLFEQEFGRALAHSELQMLVDLKNRYSHQEIVETLREAIIYGKRTINYIAKILANKAKGKTVDEQQ